MRITSFDSNSSKINRSGEQDNLYNLFQKNISYQTIYSSLFVVPREFEMRLDKVSNYLYGSPDFIEELMLLNDILSPYSIKEGDSIWYCSIENMQNLYVKDSMSDNENVRKKIINAAQPDRNKKKIKQDDSLPPTVKPSNLKQITINKDNSVRIINSFE